LGDCVPLSPQDAAGAARALAPRATVSLRSKVMPGLFWLGGTRLLSQVLTWAVTIVVIRLLSPADYGLLAMATVFMGFLALVAEAGLGPALIQAPQVDDDTLRRIFGAVILIDTGLCALQFAAAPAIAFFFAEDRLIPIIRVLALQFLLMIFTVIPTALLSRRLSFKGQSMIGLASAVGASLTSLVLALAGYGVWALVASTLVAGLCNAVALNVVQPYLERPSFSLKGMRRFMVLGGQVTAARVLSFAYSQADVFIGGRVLGKDLLGFYSVSLHLASLPVQRISGVVNQIAFPAFAQASQDPKTVPLHMLKGVRMLSLLSFPVLWGISSVAPEFVAVLLGPRWQAAVGPLQLLPLVMPITILSPFLNTAFQGIGRAGVVVRNMLTASIIMPVLFWAGTHWGVMGLSAAWLVGFPLVFLVNLRRMLPLVSLRLADVLAAIALPATAASVMYGCVAAARQVLPSGLPTPAVLATLIATGATAYAIATLAVNRKGLREALRLFRR
jgi:O-antigen/teichoic acid export membrane protein